MHKLLLFGISLAMGWLEFDLVFFHHGCLNFPVTSSFLLLLVICDIYRVSQSSQLQTGFINKFFKKILLVPDCLENQLPFKLIQWEKPIGGCVSCACKK